MANCKARRQGDQMMCGACGTYWDADGPDRPACNPTMRILPTIQERIAKILEEARGVISLSNITQWELAFLRDLQKRQVAFGSEKQLAVIARIEEKLNGVD